MISAHAFYNEIDPLKAEILREAIRAGAIAPGLLADLVVLDPEHPALLGRRGDGLLDAWVFAGNATPVRHVMVAGRWVVQHGAHVRGAEIAAAFARTMRRLAGVV